MPHSPFCRGMRSWGRISIALGDMQCQLKTFDTLSQIMEPTMILYRQSTIMEVALTKYGTQTGWHIRGTHGKFGLFLLLLPRSPRLLLLLDVSCQVLDEVFPSELVASPHLGRKMVSRQFISFTITTFLVSKTELSIRPCLFPFLRHWRAP